MVTVTPIRILFVMGLNGKIKRKTHEQRAMAFADLNSVS
jgi:hypothetical protein